MQLWTNHRERRGLCRHTSKSDRVVTVNSMCLSWCLLVLIFRLLSKPRFAEMCKTDRGCTEKLQLQIIKPLMLVSWLVQLLPLFNTYIDVQHFIGLIVQ